MFPKCSRSDPGLSVIILSDTVIFRSPWCKPKYFSNLYFNVCSIDSRCKCSLMPMKELLYSTCHQIIIVNHVPI